VQEHFGYRVYGVSITRHSQEVGQSFRTNLGGDDLAVKYKDEPNDVSYTIFYDFYDSAYKDVQGWPGRG